MVVQNLQTGKPSAACPGEDERKLAAGEAHPRKPIEVDADGVWHIHGYAEMRQILRSDVIRQAGFRAEEMGTRSQTVLKNLPILYLEGEEHDRLRRETNRFFTPAVTDKQYREFMHRIADSIIEKLKVKRSANLNDLTAEMAMQVTARVVGLTDSLVPGLYKRVNGVLGIGKVVGNSKSNLLYLLVAQRFLLAFLWLDVKPAIRKRRKNPQNDVISYLISRNYSDLEILTECVVYGVAGMATTREFICLALWHLLEKPHLRERMLVGEQEERYAILHEILRLEPVVGHLARRTTDTLEIQSEGKTVTIPAGTLLDMSVYTTNIDPEIAGEANASVCPMRPLHSTAGKVPEYVMSFGDGAHRCPGAFIAIQESDILLRKLLQLESLRLAGEPKLEYNPTIKGYEVHNFPITLD